MKELRHFMVISIGILLLTACSKSDTGTSSVSTSTTSTSTTSTSPAGTPAPPANQGRRRGLE